ncbi:TPA: NeuD/PglB/VioB family sugar acetyltransferase [Escherichia coli]|uniref:NeuD/PglB/VioB family sugar acetyltransferase n=1 Tax=Escherichia coli TaxID=562 RepID=UPI00197DFFC0|nr:NeuD/PglB/VioB family sugar acetyltransferase [Escherichia coli]HCS7072177.1 NeuD/PglB/VioB family sugar acetyltransferase [Escherichia coli]HDV5065093.1 NeuD/PglB/VioB family sugar acetyltransferase [Escherichia coli]HDV5111472.1 NeuD/PglB/VioB family sugar acetyltransferase [Escherichia coli]HDV5116267.1 NeuD/PglB/VioB family sugar acetyltransferase [Escherichia coli]
MKSIIGIYGAGGFGREVLPIIRQQVGLKSDVVFIVDDIKEKVVNETKVVKFDEFCSLKDMDKYYTVAIADSKVRMEIDIKCIREGIKPISIYSQNSVIMDDVLIGDGAILSPFTCITSNVRIGKSFHANLYSYIAHDCVIGDYVTLAPGVKCNGNVIIEDHAYVGTGAIIRPGTKTKPLVIGSHSIIGMGAVVTKTVPSGKTVFGNPAKILGNKRES